MKRIDNINWQYIPAAKTNILETLRKMGWTPPSEDPATQAKWRFYRTLDTEGRNCADDGEKK